MANPYLIPNDDKNCRLEEIPNGIKLIYVLSCDKNYPHKSFCSKGKWYVKRDVSVLYCSNMGEKLRTMYYNIKYNTMLELALYKHSQILNKIQQLQSNLNNL